MKDGAFNTGKNDPKFGVRSGPKMNPRTMNPYSTGMRGFWAWARVNNPRLYASGLPAMRSRTAMAGLGITGTAALAATSADNVGPTPIPIIDKIKEILLGVSSAYLTSEQMKAQKKVLDMQLARAQAGLPPLDINMQQYGLTGPSVGVGIESNTMKMLGWGAAALAAVYLIPKFLKR
jgi:hypothetical protein